MNLLDKISSGHRILMDGGFATELIRRGIAPDTPLLSAWALNHKDELVVDIHRRYIDAGAEVILANTMCTSPVALAHYGMSEQERMLTKKAVDLANNAIQLAQTEKSVEVIGSMAPVSAYFLKENRSFEHLHAAQLDHASRLAEAGLEIVICETMTSIVEARAALSAATSSGMDVIVSFTPKDHRHLYSGETLDTAVRAVLEFNPLAICLNCASAEIIDRAAPPLISQFDIPFGAYASLQNSGHGQFTPMQYQKSVLQYAHHVENWLNKGMKLIGGCCGTTPDHIAHINNSFPFGKVENE